MVKQWNGDCGVTQEESLGGSQPVGKTNNGLATKLYCLFVSLATFRRKFLLAPMRRELDK
jgi:hypothetical protein